ncbi:MAG: RdgB/HAM1 family non-canonical purine NTP pyrophosphatase [Verrucomicrobiales bacterium]
MLVIATHNAHKTDEIRAMLGDLAEQVTDLTQFPDIAPADETGTTFVANATIKALAACEALPAGTWALADDSGLEVDALDGAPGIYSARYSGEGATDATNREKLLRELEAAQARGKERSARFRCVLVLARNGEVVASCDGSVEGIITNEEKGDGGFGYDPLFVPEGHCATFAELSADVKNSLSHRARAVEALRQIIADRNLSLT